MEVRVRSWARLHLGFYNIKSKYVAYGSLGVAVERPNVTVRVFSHNAPEVVTRACSEVCDVVREVVNKLGRPPARVIIDEFIPRRVGLGSTTQLALSVGVGISKLLGLRYNVRRLALLLGRGRVSGVGIAVFEKGGFIVDSGRLVEGDRISEPKTLDDLPHIIFRSPLPKNWYFVVIVPKGVRGLSEREEREYLDVLADVPEDIQSELRKLLLNYIIPAVIWRNAEVFGRAVTKLQELVGRYFSKYQGGVFCCDETEYAVKALLRSGALGAGQSSWGPAAYGLVEGARKAESVAEKVAEFMERRGYEAKYYLVRAANRGAVVEVRT